MRPEGIDARRVALHRAICESVGLLNQGDEDAPFRVSAILRQALVDDADAAQASAAARPAPTQEDKP
jgi:hypothetical protein